MEFGYGIALVFGLAGSLHCAGMCGPLALALPGSRQLLLGRILYNLGRVVTYSLMGLIMGILGMSLAATPIQQYLSILSGVLILLMLLLSKRIEKAGGGPLALLNLKIRGWFSKLLNGRTGLGVLFLIGIVNGLLPCGMVYAALAGALQGGTILKGVGFMAIFGLGTIPMMLALSLAGRRIFRWRWARATIQLTTVVVAALLIMRGMNLGVPYLSPKFELASEKPTIQCGEHCKFHQKH